MNSPTIGALLAHDKVDRYRSFGAFGKPAYQSHVQMRAMLRAQRGPKVANFFARPTYDPDSGELRWTSEVPGEARAWHQMTPEEQAQHAADKFLVHGELLGLIKELREKGGAEPGGAAAFANLLEQAMKVPADDKFTFFVGDQPMIAFWGFSDASGASVVASAQPPQFAAAAAAAAADAPLFAAPLPEAAKRKRPWWWWLLWLLLALLLLALLLLLPRACTPTGGIDLRRAIPGLAPPDDAASMPRDAGRGLELPAPTASMPGQGGLPDLNATLPGAAAVDPAASQPVELQKDDKADKADPSASMPIDKPPKDDPTQPDKDAKDAKDVKDPKGRSDPPQPLKDKDMKLPDKPEDAKKLGFLEGDWKAGEGLFDKRTQKPLDLGIKFGKDGQGELTLRQPDGTTCKGAVQGRVDGGKLAIQGNQQVPCSNGSSYGAPKIECAKESGGQTQCYGVNPDGSRYFMGMRRE